METATAPTTTVAVRRALFSPEEALAKKCPEGQCSSPAPSLRSRIASSTVAVKRIHLDGWGVEDRGHFPTEDAALELLWLALRNAEKKWTYPNKEWQRALHQFAIYFPGRVPVASF
jgi:hypothetical protein